MSDQNYCSDFKNTVEAFAKESQQCETVVRAEIEQEIAEISAAPVEEKELLLNALKVKLQSRLIGLDAVEPFLNRALYLRPIEVKPTEDYSELIQKIENLEHQNTLTPRAAAIGNPDLCVTDTEISSIGALTSSGPSNSGSESVTGGSEEDVY